MRNLLITLLIIPVLCILFIIINPNNLSRAAEIPWEEHDICVNFSTASVYAIDIDGDLLPENRYIGNVSNLVK